MPQKRTKKKKATHPSKKKKPKKEHNLKPSAIHKGKTKQKDDFQQNTEKINPANLSSLTSDFSIDFVKLVDGYVHQICNLNITIFTELSKLIYKYSLPNLTTGCWSHHFYENMSSWDMEFDHYYTLKINDDGSFRLNSAAFSREHRDWPAGTFINLTVAGFKGYIERDPKGRYIMLLDHKNGLKFLKRTTRAIAQGQRQRVYFKRIVNIYKKYLQLNDSQLEKMHKRFNKKKSNELDWDCVSNKLFNDLKYGKLNIDRKKKNKAIRDMPDMHVLYSALCLFHGIKPLGVYIGNFFVKFNNDCSAVKIRYNKDDFFNIRIRNKDAAEPKVVLKVVNEREMLRFWRKWLGDGNVEERDKNKINQMVFDN